MENTSKALLIAASVLVVIILITVGIKIFNSTSNVSEDATKTGDSMTSEMSNAKIDILLGSEEIYDETYFRNYIRSNYIGNNLSADKVRELCKLVILRNKKVNTDIDVNAFKYIHISSTSEIHWQGSLEGTIALIEDNTRYNTELNDRTSAAGGGPNAYAISIKKVN